MSKMYYNTAIIECETENQSEKLFEVLSNDDNIFNSKLPAKYEDRNITLETATSADGNYVESKIYYKISTPSYAPIEFFTTISEYYNIKITLCFADMNLYYANKVIIFDSKILSNITAVGNSEIDLSIKMNIMLNNEIDYKQTEQEIISEYFSDDKDSESKTINDIGKIKLFKYLKDDLSIDKENLELLKTYFNEVYFNKTSKNK